MCRDGTDTRVTTNTHAESTGRAGYNRDRVTCRSHYPTRDGSAISRYIPYKHGDRRPSALYLSGRARAGWSFCGAPATPAVRCYSVTALLQHVVVLQQICRCDICMRTGYTVQQRRVGRHYSGYSVFSAVTACYSVLQRFQCALPWFERSARCTVTTSQGPLIARNWP